MKQIKNRKKSFLGALLKGAGKAGKSLLENRWQAIDMNPVSIKYYKHLQGHKLHSHQLLGKQTWFYSGGEYLHALQEVFMEKAYFQKLPPNATILDCGAHIGISVIYLKNLCPTAKIIAFEPDKRNFELLQRNVDSHQLQHVEMRNEAIWIENTTLQFIEEGNMGSKIGGNGGEKTRNVQAVRLRDFLETQIDFLKIDIEGAEYEVLKDIQNHLDNVKRLFIEYHGTFEQNQELIAILNIVSKAGFVFYIKEASEIYVSPFDKKEKESPYDIQLNIFCSRTNTV